MFPNANCLGGVFLKITVAQLGVHIRNANFLETCFTFTDKTDFNVVRYSAVNNLFRYQGNVVEVNRICETMCNVFAPILRFLKSAHFMIRQCRINFSSPSLLRSHLENG